MNRIIKTAWKIEHLKQRVYEIQEKQRQSLNNIFEEFEQMDNQNKSYGDKNKAHRFKNIVNNYN